MAKGHHHSSQLDDLPCLWCPQLPAFLCAPAGGGKLGTQHKEQKMHHAALFLNDTPDRPPSVDDASEPRLA
jgi:hypothetical protein